MANHVSHAALPYPVKGARYTIPVPYLDADGDPTDPTTPDTEVSKDGGAFADCAEEVTTISGSNGAGFITLSGAETDASLLVVAAKVASGPKATLLTLVPRVLAVVGSGTLSAGSAGGGTLGTLLAYDVTGCILKTTGGTGGGGTGGANNQARTIVTYNTGTGALTVSPNWETTPDNTTTYDVLLPEGVTLGMLRTLNPTTAGRTLDVSTGGEAGLDLANIGSPTTTVNLSGLTIKTATDVETDTADIQSRLPASLVSGRMDASVAAAGLATDAVTEIVAGVWNALTADYTAAGSFGESFSSGAIDSGTAQAGGASSITLRAGAPSTNLATGDVWVWLMTGPGKGESGRVTAYDTGTKVATIDGTWLTNPTSSTTYLVTRRTAKPAVKLAAADVSGNIAIDTAAVADAVWDEALSGHLGAGSTGAALNAAGSAGDPWSTAIPGAYGAGTAGYILGNRLDAAVSTRSTYAGADTAGTTTLLSRIPGTVQPQTGDAFARLGAPAGASLSADVAAVKVDTAAILDDTGTSGVVVASGSKTGYGLASSGLDAIVIETGVNARQALSPILAACAGGISGAGTGTVVIKGGNVATTRITATTDTNGNRSSVTLALPA